MSTKKEKSSCLAGYRITRMKEHRRDNFLTFENIITGDAFIGGVLPSVPPVISAMHRNPAAGVCDNEGMRHGGGVLTGRRLLSSADRLGQMTGGVITRRFGSGIFGHQGV